MRRPCVQADTENRMFRHPPTIIRRNEDIQVSVVRCWASQRPLEAPAGLCQRPWPPTDADCCWCCAQPRT